MKRSLSLLAKLLKIQVRSQLQYPTSFILEVLSSLLIQGFFFVAFGLTLIRFDQIGGWNLGEVAFVWGITEFSFAIGV